MLRFNHLTAVTRSDVVNRVIEVELPRFAIMPFDRVESPEAYWNVSRTPSFLPGGSWTKFNWRTNMIGLRTQRVEYADQVRQPQAEVTLESLVSYLLDLGAVPNQHGWRLLRTAGLWAPVGCPLMMSPDGREKVLTIAPLNDSDGHLSLALNWSGSWATRDRQSLPPYWIRLPCPMMCSNEETGSITNKANVSQKKVTAGPSENVISEGSSSRNDADSITQQGRINETSDIICEIGSSGIVAAFSSPQTHDAGLVLDDSLYIDHLRVSRTSRMATWFASAATAFGTSTRTILWNYQIPEETLRFSQKDTLPSGVLELLGLVDGNMTPQWATEYDDEDEKIERIARKGRAYHDAMLKEQRLTSDERIVAARERMIQDGQRALQESELDAYSVSPSINSY